MTNGKVHFIPAPQEIKGYGISQLAKKERNDCFVRAVAAALEISYDRAHKFAADNFERKERAGTKVVSKMESIINKGGDFLNGSKILSLPIEKKKNWYGRKGMDPKTEGKWRMKTVKSFQQDNPKGIYFVIVAKHVFVLKDGIVIDNPDAEFLPTRKVIEAYQIIPAKQSELPLA